MTRTWPCVYCAHVSRDEPESKRHRNSHPKRERVVTCAVCGRVFVNAGQAYVRHARSHESERTRFWAKVDKEGPGGCWLWTASVDYKGYGWFRGVNMKHWGAHRYAWIDANGEIPEGLELDHLCRNTGCVNPAHLEVVTHLENMRRSLPHRTRKCPYGCGRRMDAGNLVRHIEAEHREVVTMSEEQS